MRYAAQLRLRVVFVGFESCGMSLARGFLVVRAEWVGIENWWMTVYALKLAF